MMNCPKLSSVYRKCTTSSKIVSSMSAKFLVTDSCIMFRLSKQKRNIYACGGFLFSQLSTF